jgi:hypothetical protein
MSKSCCPQNCPCAQAKAISYNAFVMQVKADQVAAVLKTLATATDSLSNTLAITSATLTAIDTLGHLAVASQTTLGSAAILITLKHNYNTHEEELAQIATLVQLAGAFSACLQQIKGVLIESTKGTNMEVIAATVSAAASAAIEVTAIQTLFCGANGAIPVNVFFATKHAEVLVNIINAGMYLCTGDPIN